MPSCTCGGGAGGSESGGSEGGDGKGDGGSKGGGGARLGRRGRRRWRVYLGVLLLLCFKGKLDEVLLQLLVGVVDAQLLEHGGACIGKRCVARGSRGGEGWGHRRGATQGVASRAGEARGGMMPCSPPLTVGSSGGGTPARRNWSRRPRTRRCQERRWSPCPRRRRWPR